MLKNENIEMRSKNTMKISSLFKLRVAIVSGVFIFTTVPAPAQIYQPVSFKILDEGKITFKSQESDTLKGKGELVVDSEKVSVSGEIGSRVIVHSGSVNLRYGIYRLQADKLTIFEASNKIIAEGNIIFDKGSKRIKRKKIELNYKGIK